MNMLDILKRKREEILNKISSIGTIRRGTINEQYFKVPRKNAEPVMRGPYYVLSKSVQGKTKSQRIKLEDLDKVKKDVDAYHEFLKLSNQFVEVTEQITHIQDSEKNIDLKKTNNAPQ